MKKIILLLLLLNSQVSFSQQYIPTIDSINEWNYQSKCFAFKIASTVCNYGNYFYGAPWAERTIGDTIIQFKSYKIIEFGGWCTSGYVREDTAQKRIYFIDNLFNPEIVLYDYSLQTGDTLTINSIVNSPLHPSGVYRVDSIFNFNLPVGTSRIFYLNGSNGGNTMLWIEGVGCPETFLYPYTYNDFGFYFQSCTGIQHLAGNFLSCFSHNNKVYFDTCAFQLAQTPGYWFIDSCRYSDYCSGVNLINSKATEIEFTVSGNNLYASINDFQKQDISIEILNLHGQSVYSSIFVLSPGDTQDVTEISRFISGVYLILCKTNRETIRKKIYFPPK